MMPTQTNNAPSEHLTVDEVIVLLRSRVISNNTIIRNANISVTKI
jgi:hypothetical protein